MTYEIEKENRNTLAAARSVLKNLRKAEQELEHARSCGRWDIFNLGIMSNILKRDHMRRAESYMQQAIKDLKASGMEFMDMNLPGALHIETRNILSCADLLFDGIIVDLAVQSTIIRAEEQVAEVISRMEGLLRSAGINPEDLIQKKKYVFGPEDYNPVPGIIMMTVIVFLMIIWK